VQEDKAWDLWLNGAIRKTIFQKICDEITQQTISNGIVQKVKTSRVKTTFRRVAVRHFERHLDAVFRHYAFRRAEGKPGETSCVRMLIVALLQPRFSEVLLLPQRQSSI
jgi:hypothetical protein